MGCGCKHCDIRAKKEDKVCQHNHEHHHEHNHEHNHEHHHERHHEHHHAHEHHHGCACGHDHSHVGGRFLIYKFVLSILFFASGLILRFMLPNLSFHGIKVFIPLFVCSWLCAGCDVLIMPFKNFSKGIIFDENFLMSIATIGALVLGEWVEAASVMLFYNLGEIAQGAIVEKSRENITRLIDVSSSFARVLKEGAHPIMDDSAYEIEKPEDIKIGSILLIKPGEKVPLDSIVLEGSSELDTASMTGESMPRLVKEGDEVLQGFVNITGLLIVKTKAVLEDSEASRMLSLIEKASERKAKTEKLISSFAKVYTPIVLIASLLISTLPPLFAHYFLHHRIVGFESFAPFIHRGLVFLVISCPCAFILSVPLAYFAGIGAFAKNGILVKGADYIDGIAKTKKIIFDKTGTLTHGKMKVAKYIPSSSSNKKELLSYAILGERNSNHPIAISIIEEGEKEELIEGIENIETKEYSEKTGRGIECKVKGHTLYVGSKAFIEDVLKIELEKLEDVGSLIYVAYNNKYLGAILLQDEIKKDAKEAIDCLQRMGIKELEVLTGDSDAATKDVCEKLGIGSYHSQLLPSQKVEYFDASRKKFKEKNKKSSVMFMGDGINDAAVLSMADVGITAGCLASDAAIEASDAVFMSEDLTMIAKSIKLAKKTRRIVKENIFISFAIKLGFLALGAIGLAGLQLAVLGDVGVALLATLNSMRLKK